MQKGFTLPELLVAIAMFSLVAGAAINLLVATIDTQKRSLIGQNMTSQSSFVMEYMTRALRQAQKELSDPALCLVNQGRGYNYELTTTGEGGIRFINSSGQCQEFYLDSGRIQEVLDEESPEFITPDDFTVTQFTFVILGQSQNDTLQPRVTFVLTVENALALQLNLRIQTSISQRNLDIMK